MPPANPPPASDATPTPANPTPGAGGAGDVDALETRIYSHGANVNDSLALVAMCKRLIAERDALRAAVEEEKSLLWALVRAVDKHRERRQIFAEQGRIMREDAALSRGPAAYGQG
jgi:hypothetical protein